MKEIEMTKKSTKDIEVHHKSFTVLIPEDLLSEFKVICARNSIKMYSGVEEAVRKWVKEHA